jgi:hypothetical protein
MEVTNIKWTDENKTIVISKIDAWIKAFRAYSTEKVGQDDNCNIEAINLVIEIVDTIQDAIETKEI